MRDSRTNLFLIEVYDSETTKPLNNRKNVKLYFNGTFLEGRFLSEDEYYDYPENKPYQQLYEEVIKNPRVPHIQQYQESGSTHGFPDNLRQGYLHLVTSSSQTIQIRLADIVAFSFI